jgi:hypothetical protein
MFAILDKFVKKFANSRLVGNPSELLLTHQVALTITVTKIDNQSNT